MSFSINTLRKLAPCGQVKVFPCAMTVGIGDRLLPY
jgi:peroxiredoxin family protein